MIPQAFEYLTPKTLPEAISMIQRFGDESKILAGGHSLIPLMKLRLATPRYLIDINHIPDLDYIKESDEYLRIGALTREVSLEESALIRSKYPIILETAKLIGDPQVRNLATVGGNLAHGDPGNDHPATMLALQAKVEVIGPQGERRIPVAEFFTDFFATALEPDEILTEIRIPIPPPRSGGAYLKLERKVGDFATVGVAAYLSLDDSAACLDAGIGLTNVGPTPLKASRAEESLIGKPVDTNSVRAAAQMAAEDCSPGSDLRGPEEYKRAMVKEFTQRALHLAARRAQGGESA